MLFDEPTLRKLTALTLAASRVRAGRMRGDRRSSKRGASIEFADYRNYTPGDDLRRLDWNIYARHDKPFIKLFEDEEDLAVHLLLDGSKSMDWGSGDEHKFDHARKIAAALGAIALSAGDQFDFNLLVPRGVAHPFGPARGSHQTLRYLSHLAELSPRADTSLNASLLHHALSAARPGLLILITDLLDPAGYEDGLTRLLARGHEVVLIHLLHREELSPALSGDLKLVDAEFGYTQEITADASALHAYDREVRGWLQQARRFCASRSIHYVPQVTDTPWDKFVLLQLRAEGIVK
jgi:uncharacterized protein (DUF58 family)